MKYDIIIKTSLSLFFLFTGGVFLFLRYMFCSDCGRENLDACKCLRSNPLNKIESIIILFVFQTMVFLGAFILNTTIGFNFNELIPYISIITFIFLSVLAMATFYGKKSYLAAFFSCHQASHRSIYFNKKPLNICSRCFGIMTGLLLTGVLFFIEIHLNILIILSIPMVVDGFHQRLTSYESNNLKRFLTGVLFAPFLAFIISGYNALLIFLISNIFGGM